MSVTVDRGRFRKKPVVIEAKRLTEERAAAVSTWLDAFGQGHVLHVDSAGIGYALEVDTLEGVMTAEIGDWIIQGVQGEFYPCKPDIFEATYELVEP